MNICVWISQEVLLSDRWHAVTAKLAPLRYTLRDLCCPSSLSRKWLLSFLFFYTWAFRKNVFCSQNTELCYKNTANTVFEFRGLRLAPMLWSIFLSCKNSFFQCLLFIFIYSLSDYAVHVKGILNPVSVAVRNYVSRSREEQMDQEYWCLNLLFVKGKDVNSNPVCRQTLLNLTALPDTNWSWKPLHVRESNGLFSQHRTFMSR